MDIGEKKVNLINFNSSRVTFIQPYYLQPPMLRFNIIKLNFKLRSKLI